MAGNALANGEIISDRMPGNAGEFVYERAFRKREILKGSERIAFLIKGERIA